MKPPRPSLPRLRSHGFDAPTAPDITAALRATGSPEATRAWVTACAAADVDPFTTHLDVAELAVVTGSLAAQPGVLGLAGRALAVRAGAYRGLAAADTDRPAPLWDWAREATDHLLRTRTSSTARLEAVLAADPFSDSARRMLDTTARRAAARLGAAGAAVTVVLDGATVVAGASALGGWMAEAGGTPIEWSFCATSARTRQPLVVRDARADVIHRTNPVTVHDSLVTYAGAPLTTASGHVLGSVCVYGDQPMDLGPDHLAELVAVAGSTVAELESIAGARAVRAA